MNRKELDVIAKAIYGLTPRKGDRDLLLKLALLSSSRRCIAKTVSLMKRNGPQVKRIGDLLEAVCKYTGASHKELRVAICREGIRPARH